MKSARLITLEVAAVALFAFAVCWWLVVYGQVMFNTGMSPSSALPCLFYTSDRCSLAMALCSEWHLLGIKRYFAEPIWLASVLAALALALGSQKSDS
ncbi:MAG: hypothetical protein QM744_10730 [Mesorhizobium sp.]